MASTTSSPNTSGTKPLNNTSNTTSSNTQNPPGPGISGFTYKTSISFEENLFDFYRNFLNEDNVNNQIKWIRKLKAGAAVEAQNNPGFNTMYVDSTDFENAENALSAIGILTSSATQTEKDAKKAAEDTLKAERLKLLAKMINILAKNKYNRSDILALKIYSNNLKPKPSQTITYPSVFKDTSDDTVARLYRGSLKILTDYKSYEAANYQIDKLVMKNYNKYYQYYVFNINVEGQNYLESLREDFFKEIQRKQNLVFSEFINMMTNGTSGTYVNYYNVNQLGRLGPIQKYLSQTKWQEKDYKLFFTAVDNKGYKKWKAWALDKKEVYKTIPMLELTSQNITQLQAAITAATKNANTNLAALQAQLAATQAKATTLQQQIQQAKNASNTTQQTPPSSSNASNTAQQPPIKLMDVDGKEQISFPIQGPLKDISLDDAEQLLKDIGSNITLDTDLTYIFGELKKVKKLRKTNLLKIFKNITPIGKRSVVTLVNKAHLNSTDADEYLNMILGVYFFQKVAQREQSVVFDGNRNKNKLFLDRKTIAFLLHLRPSAVDLHKGTTGTDAAKRKQWTKELLKLNKDELLNKLFKFIKDNQDDENPKNTFDLTQPQFVNEKPRIPVYSDYEEFSDLEYEDYTDEEYGEFVDKLDQEVTQIIQEEGATFNGSESGSYDMSGSESGSYELSGSESGSY